METPYFNARAMLGRALLTLDKKLEGAAHDQIIEWIQNGTLDLKYFVSHRIPFAEMGKAFDMIEAKEKMMKMVVYF